MNGGLYKSHYARTHLSCELVLSQSGPEILVCQPVIAPFDIHFHREGKHHVDGVNAVNVQNIDSKRYFHRLCRFARIRRRGLQVSRRNDDLKQTGSDETKPFL